MIKITEHGNSGINIFEYKGQKTLQKAGVEKAFNVLAENVSSQPFERIIEIGTDYGGLTNLLADHKLSEKATMYTYDINPHRFVSHNNKINFIVTDVFTIENDLANLIQSPGRTLLLCDGGNKRKEFEVFHRYLKLNDIIMAHDYAPTEQIFNEKYIHKIWSWHEFQDSYAEFPGLEPYLQDTFANYAWCIRIKIR
jgi:hypothetical protein